MANHNEIGRLGEQLAVDYLLKHSYVILEQNWRIGRLEIDIIVQKNDVLIFVEVKTLTNSDYPEQAVHLQKQKLIVAAAEQYLEKNNWINSIRFDIIAINISNNKHNVHHIIDAFFEK